MTERTKKCRAKRIFFHIVSILLAYGPILGYLIAGFTVSDNSGKITLTICSIVGIVIALINLLAKYHIRSTIWIILLGIYMVMKDIQMLIIITAITTIATIPPPPKKNCHFVSLTLTKPLWHRV